MPDIRNIPGVPDFTGMPTEAKRIAGNGWAGKDQPTGKTLQPAPLASADPEEEAVDGP